MAEYTAGKGTTALGIIGTILGSVGTAGVLGNGASLLGGATPAVSSFEMETACQHDLDCAQKLAAKDSEIARLNAERYADSVGLKLYEYVGGELKNIRATIETNKDATNASFASQAVFNATANGTMSTIAGQVANLQTLVGSITKTAVPSSAICNFGCNSCCTTTI